MTEVRQTFQFVGDRLVRQLGVYLRLYDIPVPSIYGPSADDAGGFAE
jgi:hypothetical protein